MFPVECFKSKVSQMFYFTSPCPSGVDKISLGVCTQWNGLPKGWRLFAMLGRVCSSCLTH